MTIDEESDWPAAREDHVVEYPYPSGTSIGCSCGWQWDGHNGLPVDEFIQAWGNHRARMVREMK